MAEPNLSDPPSDPIPESIQKIIQDSKETFDAISTVPRFGFFSIVPNQILCDRYYSKPREFNHKVVDRKVISAKRGVFTTIPKTGKGHDAYFLSYDTTDEKCLERQKKGWEEDNKRHLQKVQEFKNKVPTPVFKYPGVQHYKDKFDQEPVERNFPIDKEPPRHTKVVDHKVIGEKRGIFTQPMKKGMNNTPGIYFNYIPFRADLEAKDVPSVLEQRKKRPQSSVPLQHAYKRAFFPASLKKNECFSNIKETFGYEDKYFDNLKRVADNERKSRRKKFARTLPTNAVKHDRPFTPNHLGKFGRDGLFNQRVWDCPSIPENKVIVNQRQKAEYEKAHRKNPFKYNIMMDYSKFSPSIVSNNTNMRRGYPSVFKK